MRIIIPVVIIILGMLAGAAVCALFKQIPRGGLKLSLISGAAGSFAGLLIRDALDITSSSPAGGAFLAAITGAICFSLLANIYMKWSSNTD